LPFPVLFTPRKSSEQEVPSGEDANTEK
jgi:hypothetical protein